MSRSDPRVEVLRGEELARRLGSPDTEVFRYRGNRPGFVFLLVVAGILALVGALMYADGLTTSLSSALFALVVTSSLAIASLVGYWTYFASVHFLAVTPEELIIGRRRRAKSVKFADLDFQRLGLHDLDESPTNGVLNVRAGRAQVRLHLFNPFAHVDNLERFMFQVLSRINERSAV